MVNLLALLYVVRNGLGSVPHALLIAAALELAPVPVVLAHALGRHAFARLARLPIGRPELRIFVHVVGPDRTVARLGVLAAGTLAAYLGVAALAFAFATCHGISTGRASIVVNDVLDGYDAVGKLRPGDRLLAVDGEPLLAGVPPSLTDLVNARDGAPVTVTVDRAGAVLDVTIQPQPQPERYEGARRSRWLLGLTQRLVPEHATDAATAAAFAIRFPIEQLRDLARGIVSSAADDDAPDPGGPVRIVEEFRRQLAFGDLFWGAWLYALPTASFALLVLAILDLSGAAALVRARRRRRPAA